MKLALTGYRANLLPFLLQNYLFFHGFETNIKIYKIMCKSYFFPIFKIVFIDGVLFFVTKQHEQMPNFFTVHEFGSQKFLLDRNLAFKYY